MKELSQEEKEIIKAYRRLVKETNSKNWIICNPEMMWSTYFIPISLIEKRIEILDMRIELLRKELEKSCEERETLGTETDIDNNEAYIFHIEEELNHRGAERNALRKLLDERNNTDE